MLPAHLLLFVGMFIATEDAEALRDDFLAACKMHHKSDEQIADLLGIGRGQFADQKALRQHLSLWRIANLPLAIQRDFWKLHGRRLGLTVFEDAQLSEYLSDRIAEFRKRKQQKMALHVERMKVSA